MSKLDAGRNINARRISLLVGACLACGAAGLAVGCDGGAGQARDDGGRAADVGPSPDGESPTDAGPDAVATGCRPGAGVSGAPQSIAEVVALVNSLPRPVTVDCFVESLTRPLFAVATSNVISLQPAVGVRSPRILLVSDRLIITVVPAGMGSHSVEFGEFVTPDRTLKAELGFPVVETASAAAPFDRIADPKGGSTCRGCHREELPAQAGPGFISGALRPTERSLVELDSLRAERAQCDDSKEPERCSFFRALFDHGPVLPRNLPMTVPTIFD